LPVVVQGMGFRPGARERWEDQTSFLAAARERGAAIYSMLRTQPFMRPFNWRRGTSLYDGVFHWRGLSALPAAERMARMRDPNFREDLRDGLDHPNTDPKQGSTLPMPALDRVFVDRSRAHPDDVGKSLAALAKERRVHAADGVSEPSPAAGLGTPRGWHSAGRSWSATCRAARSAGRYGPRVSSR